MKEIRSKFNSGRKIILLLVLLSFTFFTAAGCREKEYDVLIKAVNYKREVIKTAIITINDENIRGENGILKTSLTQGKYEIEAKDKSGSYINTIQRFCFYDNSSADPNLIEVYMYPKKE